jgi:hypothetical protein
MCLKAACFPFVLLEERELSLLSCVNEVTLANPPSRVSKRHQKLLQRLVAATCASRKLN